MSNSIRNALNDDDDTVDVDTHSLSITFKFIRGISTYKLTN